MLTDPFEDPLEEFLDDSPFPVPGTYQGDHSLIELVPDFFVERGWILHVNGVPSSHIVEDDPRSLVFEYMKWVVAAVEEVGVGKRNLVHLGGGALTLPRYFAESDNTVVELDGKLVELVRDWFGLPRADIRITDARSFVREMPDASADVIIRDAFDGFTAPESLRTIDFYRECRRGLVEGGLYVANCGDEPDLTVTRQEINGLTRVFAHIAAISEAEMIAGRKSGNVVVLASDSPLPEKMTSLPDASVYLPEPHTRALAARL